MLYLHYSLIFEITQVQGSTLALTPEGNLPPTYI